MAVQRGLNKGDSSLIVVMIKTLKKKKLPQCRFEKEAYARLRQTQEETRLGRENITRDITSKLTTSV